MPATDKELKRQFEEWGSKNKVKVRLDIIAHLQLQTKKAAEVQAKSGHDLTALGPGLGDAALYYDYLVDLADLAGEVGPKNGGWLRREGLPDPQQVDPAAVVEAALPDGDQDRHPEEDRRGERPTPGRTGCAIGKKAKAAGHPFGTAMGHSGDANVTLLSILWSYGGSYIAKDGETVTINSPETREAMEFVKRLYNEAMEPEVLAWDDASNNRCLNAGKCFAIHNPISAFELAKKDGVVVPAPSSRSPR